MNVCEDEGCPHHGTLHGHTRMATPDGSNAVGDVPESNQFDALVAPSDGDEPITFEQFWELLNAKVATFKESFPRDYPEVVAEPAPVWEWWDQWESYLTI